MYNHNGITVDDRFARFGSKSYAVNKITSVDVRSDTVPGASSKRLPLAILAGAAILIAFTQAAYWLLAIALLLAFYAWQARPKPPITTYRLFLVTAAGENQALETKNGGEIDALRDAIEDAMARSG